MEILIAAPRGFCAGVERAVNTVDIAIDRYPEKKIFVHHEIVHNTRVIQDFKARGVVFIENVNEAEANSVLILNAHGVSSEVEDHAKSMDLILIDASCPLVLKIHREAQAYEKENFTVLIIGNRNHAEVMGTAGRVKARTYILEKLEDIEKLDDLEGKLAYVTQSTLSCDHVSVMVNALKRKFPNIVGRSDICYATQNRQDAVKALAKEVDLMLIVGSKNSSNSNNLMRVSREICPKAFLIDNYKEAEAHWFEGVNRIGISSGASAPDLLVQELVEFLKNNFDCTESSDFVFKGENVKFKLPNI
ncbi:4-hydroxy-3-methylbut-2-enyl diphosphate reductase [Neorickettsia helminthoeca str. Oregon]|uniref:4-hydroxy-3-methylbut-2-enyl diphosphate reductase n=1 Tax=Neorickettsia helminthoeca str. Oregon TaxID=1286528 RepID=X5HJT9_9RICK|nr:4-hydroxy-3-methylbut-2-enyl diphosphate reductase [Neorickettsia helminthoeca]AHX11359.1 4-hydroxy-3-methylbut-2-enyl diphosphate reductase [Neorickettsia helminthoeca str. Oregon]